MRHVATLAVLLLPIAASASSAARVRLVDSSGQPAGYATLHDTRGGLCVAVAVEGLKPGRKEIHLEAGDRCAPALADRSARKPVRTAAVAAASRIGTVWVSGSGTGTARLVLADAPAGGARALRGAALVVRDVADPDSGADHGPRLACGEVHARAPQLTQR